MSDKATKELGDWINSLAGDYVEDWVGHQVAEDWMKDKTKLAELEAQLAESDHALDCMTSSAGELQDVCDKLEKQLEAGLSVVDNAMLNEHVRRLLKTAIGESE